MSAPEPRSPLAAFWLAPAGRSRAAAAIRMSERSLRLTEVAARGGRAASVAAALPEGAMPLAPGRWLVATPPADSAPDAAAFGDQAACIDVSGAHVVLRLSGPVAAAMLPTLCRLDLAMLQPGDVARTPMAQVPVILAVVDAAPSFDLFVPSTFARHVAEALVHAAAAQGSAALDDATVPPGDPKR